ncbi:hypothetical protein [Streptomyces brasiliscabiei]|uniref:hypothetical protein n=1 Tax=Streptomyces brasiliscabiei TaxID=2736302 RepID=UPI001C11E9C3|nr:hypothetical protein [Streptomyces brasiliscabiei]
MRPLTKLATSVTAIVTATFTAAAAVVLLGLLATPAAANPPLPLPELGTLVGEGLSVEGPLIQNVSLLK